MLCLRLSCQKRRFTAITKTLLHQNRRFHYSPQLGSYKRICYLLPGSSNSKPHLKSASLSKLPSLGVHHHTQRIFSRWPLGTFHPVIMAGRNTAAVWHRGNLAAGEIKHVDSKRLIRIVAKAIDLPYQIFSWIFAFERRPTAV
jgi:hypothetical protein